MANAKTSRYERTKYPGIVRVHVTDCPRGKCACRYQAEAYDKVTKHRKKQTEDTLAEAKAWKDDYMARLRHGSVRVTASQTLREFWELWYAGALAGSIRAVGGAHFKPAVLRLYESRFRLIWLPALGHAQLSDITLRHVQPVLDGMSKDGKAPSTVKGATVALRTVFKRALRDGLILVNPCDHAELPSGEQEADRVASPSEALRLLAEVPAEDLALWATAFFSGLRRAELMALDWGQVDLVKRTIKVTRTFDPLVKAGTVSDQIVGWPASGPGAYVLPKTKRGKRTLTFPAILVPYLAALNRTEGLVFGPDGERPFRSQQVHEHAYAAWEKAQLEPINLHACRHTFVSLCVAAGVRIDVISRWVGHASTTITIDRYSHILPDDDQAAAGQLDSYLTGAVV